jgi:8-oxoguanine deaminase
VSAQIGLAELLLSGCTTSADHQYIFPNGSRLDDTIEAAAQTGIRFHALRGSMSLGESAGGLPPDSLVEDEDAILADSERLIERLPRSLAASRLQVALAPCSPFSVSRELMRESAQLARRHGVRLHTHLAENSEDIAYSRERFNMTPGEYAEDLGWVGTDVWHAHCVQLDGMISSASPPAAPAWRTVRAPTCAWPRALPRSMRMLAPVCRSVWESTARRLTTAGTCSPRHARRCCCSACARARSTARCAKMLRCRPAAAPGFSGREAHIGQLSAGFQADCAAFAVNDLWHAGAVHDPVASLLLCHTANAAYTVVAGEVLVDDGRLVNLDVEALLAEHRRMTERLANRARHRKSA